MASVGAGRGGPPWREGGARELGAGGVSSGVGVRVRTAAARAAVAVRGVCGGGMGSAGAGAETRGATARKVIAEASARAWRNDGSRRHEEVKAGARGVGVPRVAGASGTRQGLAGRKRPHRVGGESARGWGGGMWLAAREWAFSWHTAARLRPGPICAGAGATARRAPTRPQGREGRGPVCVLDAVVCEVREAAVERGRGQRRSATSRGVSLASGPTGGWRGTGECAGGRRAKPPLGGGCGGAGSVGGSSWAVAVCAWVRGSGQASRRRASGSEHDVRFGGRVGRRAREERTAVAVRGRGGDARAAVRVPGRWGVP